MYTHSDSQIQRVLSGNKHPTAAGNFDKLFTDEIDVNVGEAIEILGIDKSKTMIKIKKQETIGWISQMSVTSNDIKLAITDKIKDKDQIKWQTNEIPQRVEQLYRQRRIAHMLEQIKGIKPEKRKVANIISDKVTKFFTRTAYSIEPHQTKIINVTTEKKNIKFQMIEPCKTYLENTEFEVLDGSYYESNGGYMIIRNTTLEKKTIKKGTYIGDGKQVELEDLPFMSLDRISTLTEKSEEMIAQEETVKEKSRKKFLEKIKDYDPGLKKVLEKYQDMYLDPNPMEFETLNIKD